ncbi:MAG: type III pantothenate kinase [Desulfobacterales bacterium]
MMLLAVDVGNTNTVIGLFENDRLTCDWRIRSTPAITEDEFNIVMSNLFQSRSVNPARIRKTIVSCVVPPMMKILDDYCAKYLGHRPSWIDAGSVKMPVLYDNPEEVGADRLVNGIAAYHIYKTSLIVIDFGTATTFDVITAKGNIWAGPLLPASALPPKLCFKGRPSCPGGAVQSAEDRDRQKYSAQHEVRHYLRIFGNGGWHGPPDQRGNAGTGTKSHCHRRPWNPHAEYFTDH